MAAGAALAYVTRQDWNCGGAIRRVHAYHTVSPSSVIKAHARGEGFIAMTRAFNGAISGLSESNTATYGQVFLGKHHAPMWMNEASYCSHRHHVSSILISIWRPNSPSRSLPCSALASHTPALALLPASPLVRHGGKPLSL